MKFLCLISLFALSHQGLLGGDLARWGVYAFAEYVEWIDGIHETDLEIGGGLGVSKMLNEPHSLAVEVFKGSNFENRATTNTFFGYDLGWQGVDFWYRFQAGRFVAGAGLSYTEIVEKRRGRLNDMVTDTRLKHQGPSILLDLGWSFVARGTLFMKYRRYVGSLEELPQPRPRFLSDGGDPDLVSFGLRWRFR